jgi:hypothetical protein
MGIQEHRLILIDRTYLRVILRVWIQDEKLLRMNLVFTIVSGRQSRRPSPTILPFLDMYPASTCPLSCFHDPDSSHNAQLIFALFQIFLPKLLNFPIDCISRWPRTIKARPVVAEIEETVRAVRSANAQEKAATASSFE